MLKIRSANSINCSECAVNFLCLPRNLDIDIIVELNDIIQCYRIVEKGTHVFHAGDKMEHLHAVHSGLCKDYWIDDVGNDHIDNFYFPGDLIGLESLPERKHQFSLIALEDLQLCIIPIDALFTLINKSEHLLKRILHINSYKMKNDQQVFLTTNAQQRVIDFLANILFRLKERNVDQRQLCFSISQIDMGKFLGIAHETINRIIRQLQRDKIIKIIQKKIHILDPERLTQQSTSVQYFGQNT